MTLLLTDFRVSRSKLSSLFGSAISVVITSPSDARQMRYRMPRHYCLRRSSPALVQCRISLRCDLSPCDHYPLYWTCSTLEVSNAYLMTGVDRPAHRSLLRAIPPRPLKLVKPLITELWHQSGLGLGALSGKSLNSVEVTRRFQFLLASITDPTIYLFFARHFPTFSLC